MLTKLGKGILILCLVLVFCSGGAFSSLAEPPALARLSGAEKERVARLIDGARKEGELVFYSAVWRPDIQAVMIPEFRKEYGLSESDFKFKCVRAMTGSIVTKITGELRAKVYTTDVVQNGTIGWFNDLVARGELMAYDSPEYKHFPPIATDPRIAQAHPPYFISGRYGIWALAYNPKYVKGEIAHWKDVLRPEHEGKISVGDVSKSYSYTNAYLALRKALGRSFFEELGKRKPFVTLSASDLVNRATTGEYPIVVIAGIGIAARANVKGAGLKLVMPPEGYAAVGYPTAILAHAPHPNAAKLLIEFTHSAIGQQRLLETARDPVTRLGIKAVDSVSAMPIYEMPKGIIEMDWRKATNQQRAEAREEFTKLVGEMSLKK
jgi:iron(III) transport system substrate-binding protein